MSWSFVGMLVLSCCWFVVVFPVFSIGCFGSSDPFLSVSGLSVTLEGSVYLNRLV